MLTMLQIIDATKVGQGINILNQLLIFVDHKNEIGFIEFCNQQFKTIELFKEFTDAYPNTIFVLNNDDTEIEHSTFLYYLGRAEECLWPSNKENVPAFGAPTYTRESFYFRDFSTFVSKNLNDFYVSRD